MSKTIAVIGSVVVLLVILHDAFEVMLLPRRVKSRLRIVRMFFRFTWLICRKCGRGDRLIKNSSLYLRLTPAVGARCEQPGDDRHFRFSRV